MREVLVQYPSQPLSTVRRELLCFTIVALMSVFIDADIVCSRAKNHYDPSARLDPSESGTADQSNAEAQLKIFKDNFNPINERMKRRMYFS